MSMSWFAQRRWLGGLAASVLLAGVAGCGAAPSSKPSSPSTAPSQAASAAAKQPYVIYAELSLTGGASFLGKEEQAALLALQKQVNAQGGIDGRPIEFKILDNESSPKVAVQLASPLVQQQVPLLLNGSVTATAAAVDALVKNGPLTYALTPGVHPSGASNYAFSTSHSTRDLIQAAFNFFKAKGWTRIAAITSLDASGQDGWDQIQWVLSQPQYKDFKLLTHQTFDDNAVNVSSQIENMVATNPQAVIVWSTGSPAEVVFKDMAQSPLENVPVVTTNGNQTYTQMHLWAQFLPKQLYFGAGPWALPVDQLSGPVKQAVQAFDAAFQDMTVDGKPVKPDIGETLSWDPAEIFIQLLRTNGLNANATQLRDALEHLQNWPGVNGIYNFTPDDHRGLSLNDVYMVQWDPAKDAWIPVSGPGGVPQK